MLVDQWPFLAHLPSWLQWWRRDLERMRRRDTMVYMKLLNRVKERIANGSAKPSGGTWGLEKQEEWVMNDIEVAYTSAAPWQAGTGTTALSAIDAGFYSVSVAMLVFPEVLKKAQEKIGRMTGRDRQPDFDDMNNLPCLRASIEEPLRWRPTAPVGLSHSNTRDGEYQGMYIPKGSKILANIEDPVAYPSSGKFMPERFLDPNPTPTFSAAFGFGRRHCHGMFPDPNDSVGDLMQAPGDVPYELHLRVSPEKIGL